MHATVRALAFLAIGMATAATTAFAAPPTEACTVLTAAQVSAAVGATVSEGSYIMPTFKATCTWRIADGGSVTLQLQTLAFFNAGKGSLAAAEVARVSGVGDEAYYIGVGPTTGLDVRKGSGAFKVSVYSRDLSLDQRKAMERKLALEALAKF